MKDAWQVIAIIIAIIIMFSPLLICFCMLFLHKYEIENKKTVTRGAINGFIQQLKNKSILNVDVNPEDKKETAA